MQVRTILLALAAGLALVAATVMPRGQVGPNDATRVSSIDPPASIHVFYSPLGLVRAGDRVQISVDAICTTVQGNHCPADVTLGTQVAAEPWEVITRAAQTGLEFDVTDAAARAAADGTGAVRFFLRAHAAGVETSMGSPQSPLKFWVVPTMSELQMPSIPFDRIRKPTSMLFLPWGTGTSKAGLSPGRESLTGGPSSFDIDDAGRIHLLDTEQDRLAVFFEGELVYDVPMSLDSDADLSVAANGTAYIAEVTENVAKVREVSPSGQVQPAESLGEALSSHIRTVANRAYVNLLPADVWVNVRSETDAVRPPLPPETFVGAPIAGDGELVRIGSTRTIRLGKVSGDQVSGAVDVRSDMPLGEVALAEPDGNGGYWCVVRVWREDPSPADQYQVLHISREGIVESFAVRAEQFAETPPLSRFRLGGDGDLYQLTTSPSGVRIVRFDLGGQS